MIQHKISGYLNVEGKSGLDIRNQKDKSYKIDELFFLGHEKVKKMQAGVIAEVYYILFEFCYAESGHAVQT